MLPLPPSGSLVLPLPPEHDSLPCSAHETQACLDVAPSWKCVLRTESGFAFIPASCCLGAHTCPTWKDSPMGALPEPCCSLRKSKNHDVMLTIHSVASAHPGTWHATGAQLESGNLMNGGSSLNGDPEIGLDRPAVK